MKTPGRIRSRWAHCNTPAALARRRAAADARREALPAVDPGPQPGQARQTVQVIDASGRVALRLDLVVPTRGRCDQHAALINGAPGDRLLTATDVGRLVAAAIVKRPTRDELAELRTYGTSGDPSA